MSERVLNEIDMVTGLKVEFPFDTTREELLERQRSALDRGMSYRSQITSALYIICDGARETGKTTKLYLLGTSDFAQLEYFEDRDLERLAFNILGMAISGLVPLPRSEPIPINKAGVPVLDAVLPDALCNKDRPPEE